MIKNHTAIAFGLAFFALGLSFSDSVLAEDALPAATVELETLSIASSAEQPEKWYEKSFQEILSSTVVTTATRNPSTVRDAPGVVSVYTAADIKRMGLRTLKELLERVPGFFINRQFGGASIGSRGIIADTDQFLLLIDGHNMNSIVDKGMGETFLFPNLDYVDRVEIIRGPGSTLWGSDASLGIIHIITKNAGDIDGARVTASTSNEDRLRYVNLQVGEEVTEDINMMASFTVAESEGFPVTTLGGVTFDVGPWDQLQDSYELYAKAQVRNLTIRARAYDTKTSRPYDIFQSPDEPAMSRRSHYFLDMVYDKDITSTINLETRLFSDLLKRTQIMVSPVYAPDAVIGQDSQSSQENSLGFEMILRWQPVASHNVLFGYRNVRTELSPFTDKETYPIQSSPTATAGVKSQFVVPQANDVNSAFFIEDNWQIVPNRLSLTAGIRFDKNSLRENNTIVLPRLAVNWHVVEQFQVKYSYNTGYIRPSVGIGFLGQEKYVEYQENPFVPVQVVKRFGVSQSQEIASQDIQFIFSSGEFQGNLNFYYTQIDNPFQILAEDNGLLPPDRTVAFYVNTNKVTSKGMEIELAYKPSRFVELYANFSYVFDAAINDMTGSSGGINYDLNNTSANFGEGTFTPDGTMSGYPHIMFNTGINYFITDTLMGNLHLRFWDDMQMREPFIEVDPSLPDTVTLGSEYFVDFNLRYEKILGSNLDASLFVKNVLDNDDSLSTMLLFGTVWIDQGRRIGASLSYKF